MIEIGTVRQVGRNMILEGQSGHPAALGPHPKGLGPSVSKIIWDPSTYGRTV